MKAPTELPSTPAELPKALTEPARRIGNLLAAAAVLVGGLLALVQPFTELVPGEYHGQVSAALAAAGAAVAVATRLAAELIRGRVTPFNADLASRFMAHAATSSANATSSPTTSSGTLPPPDVELGDTP